MSLTKAIQQGKEKRKQYYGSRRVDSRCRCHGSCEWCKQNRLHAYNKEDERTAFQLAHFEDER